MPYVAVTSESERQQLLGLLAEGFPGVQIDWRSAFEAPAGRSGHGTLLIVDGRAQGAILAFEKQEAIGGCPHRIVNLSSWYIRRPYRSHAPRMLRAVTAEPDASYTICSPSSSVQQIG